MRALVERRCPEVAGTPRPTFAQEGYAQALVECLREERQFSAEGYGRKVLKCQDRQEMSHLIDEMKRQLADLEVIS
jgi:hypothetical protein